MNSCYTFLGVILLIQLQFGSSSPLNPNENEDEGDSSNSELNEFKNIKREANLNENKDAKIGQEDHHEADSASFESHSVEDNRPERSTYFIGENPYSSGQQANKLDLLSILGGRSNLGGAKRNLADWSSLLSKSGSAGRHWADWRSQPKSGSTGRHWADWRSQPSINRNTMQGWAAGSGKQNWADLLSQPSISRNTLPGWLGGGGGGLPLMSSQPSISGIPLYSSSLGSEKMILKILFKLIQALCHRGHNIVIDGMPICTEEPVASILPIDSSIDVPKPESDIFQTRGKVHVCPMGHILIADGSCARLPPSSS